MRNKIFAAVWVVPVVLFALASGMRAAEVKISDQPPQEISVRNVSVKDGAVSGEVVNSSSRTLRDVQLLIRFTWLWKNEMKPKEDTRSDAVFQTVEGDIPAGGSKPFTYRPSSPMTSQADGRYEATVKIAGFTQLIPAK
jgi:hypothetical protein